MAWEIPHDVVAEQRVGTDVHDAGVRVWRVQFRQPWSIAVDNDDEIRRRDACANLKADVPRMVGRNGRMAGTLGNHRQGVLIRQARQGIRVTGPLPVPTADDHREGGIRNPIRELFQGRWVRPWWCGSHHRT